MKNKKGRVFLLVSFAFLGASVVAVISSIIVSYYEIKADFPDDNIRVMNEFGYGLIIALVLIFPFLGSEVCGIRSAYKILRYEPRASVKICYTISSVLAFFAVVFYYTASFGLIRFVEDGGYNYTATVLLYTEWPLFILSFILGSIRHKRIEH